MSVRPFFAWFDFWVGVFYDRPKRRLYIMPIPMVGVVVQFRTQEFAAEQKHYEKQVGGPYRSDIGHITAAEVNDGE